MKCIEPKFWEIGFDRFKYLRHTCLKRHRVAFIFENAVLGRPISIQLGCSLSDLISFLSPLFIQISDRLCHVYSCWYHSVNHDQGTCNQKRIIQNPYKTGLNQLLSLHFNSSWCFKQRSVCNFPVSRQLIDFIQGEHD